MTDPSNIDALDLDTEALDFDTEALDPKTVSQADLDHYAPLSIEVLNEILPQYELYANDPEDDLVANAPSICVFCWWGNLLYQRQLCHDGINNRINLFHFLAK